MFDKFIDPKVIQAIKDFLKFAAIKLNEFAETTKENNMLQHQILDELKKLNAKGGK